MNKIKRKKKQIKRTKGEGGEMGAQVMGRRSNERGKIKQEKRQKAGDHEAKGTNKKEKSIKEKG